MKKIITLALMLVLVAVAFASCTPTPNTPDDGEHVHSFNVTENIEATCEADGVIKSACSCGETKEEVLPAIGHDMQESNCMAATCTGKGVQYYKCSHCGKSSSSIISPLGHEFGEPSEPSRFAFCTRSGCATGAFVTESNGTYDEQTTFNFTKEHEDELTAKYEEVLKAITSAPTYDPELHGYATTGQLAEDYEAIDKLHTELYDLVLYAVTQRQIAEVKYYCDMSSTELEETYSYMKDYYTELLATFYSLSQPFYDSCYREFFYYGMTEPEIKAYLFDSSAVSNPAYMELKSANDALELEMLNIEDPINSDRVPELYAEFAANNNAIAQLMGYENYLEYAYENVYGREYTYTDVSNIVDYVKEYISPAFIDVYNDYVKMRQDGGYNKTELNNQTTASFFINAKANQTLNDYMDLMAITSNPDKQYSFSDELNGLVSNGNMFRGQYSGAFVTSLSAFDLPIAYFSGGYDNPFTVAHEFGHYMNEVYNKSEYDQSYDLLEVHSQGNEMLYLYFLDGKIDGSAYEMLKLNQLANMLNMVFAGIAIDAFEQAVYLNYYDGYGSDEIMADGKITADEYDNLYYCITEDLGVRGFISDTYWRYGMTVSSPCYYVSYSVSALCSLQIYEKARTEGFEAASEAYLKLMTYTDENPDMSTDEIFEYAGLHTYTDKELYEDLYNFFLGK